MVIKNIYVIRIIATLFLFQHSLHAIRFANVAAVTKKYNNHATHFYPKYSTGHKHNKRNQRTAVGRHVVSNTVGQYKSNQSVKTVPLSNALIQQQAHEKKVVEQPKQNQTQDPIILPVVKEEKQALSPSNPVKEQEQSANSLLTPEQTKVKPRFLDREQVSISKKNIDHYDPYAHIKASPSAKKHSADDKTKKSTAMPTSHTPTVKRKKEATDLYMKRLKEFNESLKTPVHEVNSSQNIETTKMPQDYTEHRYKKHDDTSMVINDDIEKKSEPFQVGQMYAHACDTISNMFKPTKETSDNIEKIDIKESVINDSLDSLEKVIIGDDVQVGEVVVNSSNNITNGLNAVWQYGKDSVKNAWNNCTTYDFWLKPYEMFSQKVLQKDPTTSKDVQVVRGNLHALLINKFGNTQSTDAIYYLLRTGMVILGMALFYKPSLITENGTKQVTVQIASGLMQLVTGGSLASVVGMITGGALKALPAALPFGKAQASVPTIASAAPKTSWGQWAFGWAKNIGTTSLLNQLCSYKIRKDPALKDVNIKEVHDVELSAESQPSVKLTENKIEKNVNNLIPEKDLENAFNNFAHDPKANEDLCKLLLLSSHA